MSALDHLHHKLAESGVQQMQRRRFGLETCPETDKSLSDFCDWLLILRRAQGLHELTPPQALGPSLGQLQEHVLSF